MINKLFEKLPEVLQTALERLKKSQYAKSSPERREALNRLIYTVGQRTEELSKLLKVDDEVLTDQQKDIILGELDKKLRGE